MIPKSRTPKQLKSFLGSAGYCRQWILDYAMLARPLLDLMKGQTDTHLLWNTLADKSFVSLKQRAWPRRQLSVYTKPFTLYCLKAKGFAQGVLTQQHGNLKRPIDVSSSLDTVVSGSPSCLRAVCVAEACVEATSDIVLGSSLAVLVPHAVCSSVTHQNSTPVSHQSHKV